MDSITSNIWIGNHLDAADRVALEKEGIRSVLCLDGCLADVKPEDLGVHCHAGQSRSAAVVCKFFMQEEGNTLAEAMRRITSKRRVAIVAGLQEALSFT